MSREMKWVVTASLGVAAIALAAGIFVSRAERDNYRDGTPVHADFNGDGRTDFAIYPFSGGSPLVYMQDELGVYRSEHDYLSRIAANTKIQRTKIEDGLKEHDPNIQR